MFVALLLFYLICFSTCSCNLNLIRWNKFPYLMKRRH